MPILSGRALAVNEIELVGILLALSILFWIPTHTLTFSIKFRNDYKNAGVPTFPETYGERFTRAVIAISSILAAARHRLGKRSDRVERGLAEFDRGIDCRYAHPGLCHPAHPHGQDELYVVPLCIALHVERDDHFIHSRIYVGGSHSWKSHIFLRSKTNLSGVCIR